MKVAVWFVVLFVLLQIFPLSESMFHPYTEWHVLAAAFLEVELEKNSLASALGEITGDAVFIAFVIAVALIVNGYVRRRSIRIAKRASEDSSDSL